MSQIILTISLLSCKILDNYFKLYLGLVKKKSAHEHRRKSNTVQFSAFFH